MCMLSGLFCLHTLNLTFTHRMKTSVNNEREELTIMLDKNN